jgi:hypothetical protein
MKSGRMEEWKGGRREKWKNGRKEEWKFDNWTIWKFENGKFEIRKCERIELLGSANYFGATNKT